LFTDAYHSCRSNDLGDQDDDSQVDPSILEQLAGAGIPTETVETDLVAGTSANSTFYIFLWT
jgi:hypothetical protein